MISFFLNKSITGKFFTDIRQVFIGIFVFIIGSAFKNFKTNNAFFPKCFFLTNSFKNSPKQLAMACIFVYKTNLFWKHHFMYIFLLHTNHNLNVEICSASENAWRTFVLNLNAFLSVYFSFRYTVCSRNLYFLNDACWLIQCFIQETFFLKTTSFNAIYSVYIVIFSVKWFFNV